MTAPRRRLLVATGSAHKLIELQRLFGDLPIDLVTLRDMGISRADVYRERQKPIWRD
ncbi:MAG: hypothetical protein ACKOFY_03325 [Candidatus Limnocylindrus sp.]